MKIWLLTIGEPVPFSEENRERLHGSGQFATFLSERGHDVTWWTSTFDHWKKIHYYDKDFKIIKNKQYTIRLLYGGGYRSNASVSRFLDHYKLQILSAYGAF